MTRIIGVVSGKGGVGKTTTVINISAALMSLNKNVIAVDADIKMSCLGLQLGMYYFPVTLNDVLTEKENIYEALYIHSSGLRIIPASLTFTDAKISRLKKVLDDPFLNDNIILVDAPPGFENNALSVLKTCPEVLLVTTPEIPAVTDLMKIISFCNENETKPLGVIVNMYKKRERDQVSINEIETTCNLPVIGIIPEDRTIKKGIFRGIPGLLLNPYSPSSIAFKKIATHLAGLQYKTSRFESLKGFLGRFKK
jgi:septum site-determining protein MinD